MTPATLTIDPEDVRASARDTSARPAWLEKVAGYVQRAASEGETVTLTAKQRMRRSRHPRCPKTCPFTPRSRP